MRRREFIKNVACVTTALSLRLFGADDAPLARNEEKRLKELDAFWREIERAVREGDFDAYRASCHETGVLVRGAAKTTEPLRKALAKWKQGFLDTKAGRMKAAVEVRFSQRLGDETTAHETGIFRYSTEKSDGTRTDDLVHFEALLVRTDRWKTLMEYQKGAATQEEWNRLSDSGETRASVSK